MAAMMSIADPELVTLREGVEFLADTPHPVSLSGLRRLLAEAHADLTRLDGRDWVRASVLVVVHRDAVKAGRIR